MYYKGKEYEINQQLTLEEHFKNMALFSHETKMLYNVWELLRTDITEHLASSRSVFVHFSLHDSTHSRTVISAIEMFLGEERIKMLSVTDTFMLLVCAYAHDYGMALSIDQVYSVLQSGGFATYIAEERKKGASENIYYIEILSDIIKEKKYHSLADIYLALIVVLEDYLRPNHWQGVTQMETDLAGLLNGRVKIRLIKSIIQICQSHGYSINQIVRFERYAQGVGTDIFHPRFIAAMLQLGDLLDLDNGRFPKWFVNAAIQDNDTIPPLSKLHYLKHEAISHYYVGPKRIQVVAHCEGEHAVKVAEIVDDWLNMLESTCTYLIREWSEITQESFGRPPRVTKRDIFIRTESNKEWRLYSANNRPLRMQMSQKKVMKLLEGTNIYTDRYVGIRELVQNAIDASLLQLWFDIINNRYANLIDKDHILWQDKKKISFRDIPPSIFGFYDIQIELIRDYIEEKVFVVVKDKGVGITEDDVEFMANIGESKEGNHRLCKIMDNMPSWLKPSGIFGIGLQSVFQLTDEIKFFSRHPNAPEKEITFYSYGKNRGRIEIQNLEKPENGIFYNNYMQGTNVKFAVNCEKLFSEKSGKNEFQYYDPCFDGGEKIDAVFVEMAHVIKDKLKENPFDYFNVYFQTMTIYPSDPTHPDKSKSYRTVYCFFNPLLEKM